MTNSIADKGTDISALRAQMAELQAANDKQAAANKKLKAEHKKLIAKAKELREAIKLPSLLHGVGARVQSMDIDIEEADGDEDELEIMKNEADEPDLTQMSKIEMMKMMRRNERE